MTEIVQELIRDKKTDDIITLYQKEPAVFKGVDVFSLACLHGNLPLVIWLHQMVPEYSPKIANCSDNALLWSINNKHLSVVKWLLRKRPEFSYGGIKLSFKPVEEAVKTGDLNIVIALYEYLKDKTKSFNSRFGSFKKALIYALNDNFYFIVKWILSINSTYLTESHILYVVETGNLSMLKFLHKLNNSYLSRAKNLNIHAAKFNQIEIVEWLYSQNNKTLIE